MAVTSCAPIDIAASARGNSRNRVTFGHRVTFKVETDDAIPNGKVVVDYFRTSGAQAWIGGGFNVSGVTDAKTKCRSIVPTFIKGSGNPNLFHVDCEFESVLPTRDDIQIYSTSFSVAQEAAQFAGALNTKKLSPFLRPGKHLPVTNSAGAMHEPQMEEEVDVKVVRITKTVAEHDGNALDPYQGLVNSDEVTIDRPDLKFKLTFGPRFGRLRVVGTDLVWNDSDEPEWRQTCEIWINPRGWRRSLLDQGTHETVWPGEEDLSVGDLAELRRLKDDDGYPITQPVPLDGNGKKLDIDKKPAVYLTWITKPEGPFMPLKGKVW